RQAAEAGEAKHATEAAQSREAKQPLASGNEAQEAQKAEEPEKAIAAVSRPADEFPGQRRLVFRIHFTSPFLGFEGAHHHQCAKREDVTAFAKTNRAGEGRKLKGEQRGLCRCTDINRRHPFERRNRTDDCRWLPSPELPDRFGAASTGQLTK